MAEAFDPYFKWLGIRPEHQPPDHYRLLGLQRFESDVEVIENAADAKMSFLRSFRLGERMVIAERLLNELAEAKVCLLNSDRKLAYDAKLRQDLADAQETAKAAAPLRTAIPVAKAVVPAEQSSAGQASDTDIGDRDKLPKVGRPKHLFKRRPKSLALATSIVVGSAAVLALVLMLPASRISDHDVARGENPSVVTVRPALPPVEPATSPAPEIQPSPRLPDNTNRVPPTNSDLPTAQTKPPADDQQQVAPATVKPPQPQPEPLSPEVNPPVGVVLPPSATEPQPDPADATATVTEPIEPAGPTASDDADVNPDDVKPVAVAKSAIPATADQAAIEANIREVYQATKTGTPEQRQELAEKLLDDAIATGDAPNEQFVMLRMAAETAAAAGDLERASFAVGLIDERFQIDAVAMRLNLIEQAAKAPSSPEQKQQAMIAALPLFDAALEANRFAEVEKVLVQVQTAAKRLKDTQLNEQLAELRKKAGALAKDHEKAKAAFAVLQSAPDDPQANLTVGSFWCFAKHDWEKGLPFLAKGADQSLAAVAAGELAQPTEAADRAGLADAWYKIARGAKDYEKDAMLRRAADWYKKAIPELTGLLATAAQKNLDEIEASLAKEGAATTPKTRLARIVAACDSEFELYLNGEFLLRGSSFDSRFGSRFGRNFGNNGNNGNNNNGNNNNGNFGNNNGRNNGGFREAQQVERELKAGDVLIARCSNRRSERGFACVIEFLDDKATIATAPGGAWKLFAPRDANQWFDPNGIAATDSAKPADGDKHLRIFEETGLRCLSIWGSNPSRAYFVLKLR